MIEIEGLTVRFGGVTSLRELDVAFADRVTGIVGPNGAGKTTLLNVLTGFVRPAAGDIRVDGASMARIVPHRRAAFGVRRTFQTEQVVENRSVIDNVAAAADHVPLARGHADAVRRALGIVGLERAIERRAGELGMFERRMLEIARAIVGQPKVVMLDEPGAGLAEAESARLRAVVASLPEQTGAQILLVDHDVDFISAVCSSTLVLDFGSRIAFGPTADVLADPRVRAAYLGTPDAVLA